MTLEFLDPQDASNPLNATKIESAEELAGTFERLRTRNAFVFQLAGNNDYKLTVGLAEDVGFVQYGLSNGDPPYLLALPPAVESLDPGRPQVEFLCGNTPTPVPARYYLPHEMVKEIAIYFLETGKRSAGISWEDI